MQPEKEQPQSGFLINGGIVEFRRLVHEIAPKINPAYSPNLYRYAKKKSWPVDFYRVSEKSDRFDAGQLLIGRLWPDGDFIGSRLMGVLCNGGRETTWSYGCIPIEHMPGMWDEYRRIGRCAFDKEHQMYFVGDESRWREEGDHRTCSWCNHCEQRRVYKATLNFIEKWEAA